MDIRWKCSLDLRLGYNVEANASSTGIIVVVGISRLKANTRLEMVLKERICAVEDCFAGL